MPTASQSAAGLSFLCLAGAGAWLVMSEFPIADPGRPTTSAGALRVLEAAVPAIGQFSSFDVNDENPFVPYALRVVETKTKQSPPAKAGKTPQAKPPVIDEPAKPVLPRLAAPGSTGPAATGIVLSKDGPQALLTFPGEKNARVMKAGDSTNGWTLVEIEGGNIARVKQDATGAVVNLVIPENLAAPKKPDAGKDGKGKQPVKQDGAGKGQQPGAEAKGGKGPEAPQPSAQPVKPGDKPVDAEPKLPPRPDKLM